jgi:hypothetical protein
LDFAGPGGVFLARGDDPRQGQSSEVGSAGNQGAPGALALRELAERVNLDLEAGQESSAGRGGGGGGIGLSSPAR